MIQPTISKAHPFLHGLGISLCEDGNRSESKAVVDEAVPSATDLRVTSKNSANYGRRSFCPGSLIPQTCSTASANDTGGRAFHQRTNHFRRGPANYR